MTATGNLLDLTRAAQAIALTAENVKLVKKASKKKGITVKNLTGTGVKNIIGIELIRAQGKLSSGL